MNKIYNSEKIFDNIKTATEFHNEMNIIKQQLYSDEDLLAVKIGENAYVVRDGRDSVSVLRV